jgi:hypothetical protein
VLPVEEREMLKQIKEYIENERECLNESMIIKDENKSLDKEMI